MKLLVVHNSEWDFWDLLIERKQPCEMCNAEYAYTSYKPTSDGDTVPNCLECLNRYNDFTEVIQVA